MVVVQSCRADGGHVIKMGEQMYVMCRPHLARVLCTALRSAAAASKPSSVCSKSPVRLKEACCLGRGRVLQVGSQGIVRQPRHTASHGSMPSGSCPDTISYQPWAVWKQVAIPTKPNPKTRKPATAS